MFATNSVLTGFRIVTGIALLAALYAMNGGVTTMAYGVSTAKTAMVIAYDWPRISMKIVPVGDHGTSLAKSKMYEPTTYPALVFDAETYMNWNDPDASAVDTQAKTTFCTKEKAHNSAFSGLMPACGPVITTEPMTRMLAAATTDVLPADWYVVNTNYAEIKKASDFTAAIAKEDKGKEQKNQCRKMVKSLSSFGMSIGIYICIAILVGFELLFACVHINTAAAEQMNDTNAVNLDKTLQKIHAVLTILVLIAICVLGGIHARNEHHATTPDSGWMKDQTKAVEDADSHCYGDVFVRSMAAAYPGTAAGTSKLQFLGHWPEQMEWKTERIGEKHQFNEYKSSFVQGKVKAHAIASGFAGTAAVLGFVALIASMVQGDDFGYKGMFPYTKVNFAL